MPASALGRVTYSLLGFHACNRPGEGHIPLDRVQCPQAPWEGSHSHCSNPLPLVSYINPWEGLTPVGPLAIISHTVFLKKTVWELNISLNKQVKMPPIDIFQMINGWITRCVQCRGAWWAASLETGNWIGRHRNSKLGNGEPRACVSDLTCYSLFLFAAIHSYQDQSLEPWTSLIIE